jgi:hypothetical protein
VTLAEAAPGFSDELKRALARREPLLAAASADLKIVAACGCGDPDCASFYAVKPSRAARLWRRGGRSIELNPDVTVDVVGGTIIAIEVHRRPQLRKALRNLAIAYDD